MLLLQGTSNYDKEHAWDSIRSQLQRAYIVQLPQQQQVDQELADRVADLYQRLLNAGSGDLEGVGDGSSSGTATAVAEAAGAGSSSTGAAGVAAGNSSNSRVVIACPCCGSAQAESHRVPVVIIDTSCRVLVRVPVMRCSNENCGCTTASQPLHVSCWPSNPSKAQDVTTAGPNEQQIWFTLRFMQHVDYTVMIARRMPMYRQVSFCWASSGILGSDGSASACKEQAIPNGGLSAKQSCQLSAAVL
jgi:hypothetical protein